MPRIYPVTRFSIFFSSGINTCFIKLFSLSTYKDFLTQYLLRCSLFFYSSRYLSLNNSYSWDNYSSYFRISASFSSYSLFSVSSIKNFLPCCCWIILYIIYIFIASFISLNHSIQNSSACLSFIIIFLVVAISVLNLFVIIIRWLSYKCSFL